MKKLPRFKKKKSVETETPNRITNETVAEHREKVLAGGRRFKYPVQYAKHRLVINTIIISVVALLVIILLVWWQLYPQQNSATFLYRITRAVPVSVASVDGQSVRYSDYLESFRAQEHYIQYKEGVDLYAKENKIQLELIKRQSLDEAIADSYAMKLAKNDSITVSKQEVDEAILRQRQSRDGVTSEKTYYAIVLDHFNWSPEEVREVTKRKLLRQKVAYGVDVTARTLRDQVVEALKKESDFDKIAASIQPINGTKVESSVTPLVPSNNQDGGLAEKASTLQIGQVSPVFRSTTGDGYYVVKLLQKDTNGRISYASIKIPLTMFNEQLKTLKQKEKIVEYISVPAAKKTSLDQ